MSEASLSVVPGQPSRPHAIRDLGIKVLASRTFGVNLRKRAGNLPSLIGKLAFSMLKNMQKKVRFGNFQGWPIRPRDLRLYDFQAESLKLILFLLTFSI